MLDSHTVVSQGLGPLLPRLWRFAIVLTRDHAAAEDLVQATCLRALERARQFDPGTRLDHWSFAIQASIWQNEVRRRTAFGRVVSRALSEPDFLQGLSAEEALAARQAAAMVDKLPDAQREVVALVYFEGFTYREAAETLGIPVGTVTSRLNTARQALQRLLGAPGASPQPSKTLGQDR
jgi:RNA polymerase sigma-70 factor (ECF subfamily)